MEKNKNVAETEMSLSKQRKMQRKIDIEKSKRNRAIGKVVGWVVLVLLAVAVCAVVFFGVRRLVTRVTPNNNFSTGLDAKGHVDGVVAGDIVTLPTYNGIKVEYKDIKLSDDDLKKKIEAIQAEHAAQSTTTDKAVAKGDVIVVEYKSYFEDGTAVTDGVSDKDGSTITVGSSSLKDYGFDEALIGKKISTDTFTVEVKFPSTYTKDKAVAGKTINYVVAIKSIKITPEFDDELIKEHYSDKAKTAEEYKTYLRDEAERSNLKNAVVKKLLAETKVTKYPKYMKQLKSLIKYNDIAEYNYYVQMYASIIAYFPNLSSFEKYVGMSMGKYDISLIDAAKSQLDGMLTLQAIAEKENISTTLAEYRAYSVEQGTEAADFDKSVEFYGENYMVQQYLQFKVIEFVADHAEVTGK